jgi:lipid II:glycine glycyltransferase (peptidoglycan interpeptide bridge formation enzyme)
MNDNIVDFPQHSDLDRQFLELEQQQELIRNQRAEIMEKEQDNLTPAQQSELKFLRQQVDMWQDKVHTKYPLPNAAGNLWTAREELTRYVSDLRTWGKKI